MQKMMLLTVLVLLLCGQAQSQNVGVGTSTPSEKLDVNGNVNIQGNIKLNGAGGQEGQVLMTNASGTTVWADLCGYKNVVALTQNGTWNVPAGVTKVSMELWGGGGGGAFGGGGSSSSYVKVVQVPVTPGGSIAVIVGAGGSGATTEAGNAINGTNSKVTISPEARVFVAMGGVGAKPGTPGMAGMTVQLGDPYYFEINGNNGSPTEESYHYDGTDYIIARKFGDGGASAFLNYGEGKGGFRSIYKSAPVTLRLSESTRGSGPGAGGGGGIFYGSPGGTGMVIIYY